MPIWKSVCEFLKFVLLSDVYYTSIQTVLVTSCLDFHLRLMKSISGILLKIDHSRLL
jgi:hypothetical protein